MLKMVRTLAIAILLVGTALAGECGIDNCIGCFNGQCTQCQDNYYLASPSSCLPCTTNNCRTCTPTYCNTCAAGYYLVLPNKVCNPCANLHCLNCASNASCTTCMLGYFPSPNDEGIKICLTCVDNCVSCSTGKSCDQCNPGYFIVQAGDGNFCQSCSTNLCATCDNQGNCLTCPDNHYIYVDPITNVQRCYACGSPNCLVCANSTQLCSVCRTGYYLDSNQKDECQPCSSGGCSACSGPAACTDCLEGFKLSSSQCLACLTANCKNCDYDVCTVCKAGYFLKPVNSVLSCLACTEINCLSCESNTFCTSCLPQHYLSNHRCISCQDPNCLNCPGNICQQCQPYYYPGTTTGLCTRCPTQGCTACDSQGSCLSCQPSTYLINGKCEPCAVSNCKSCQANSIAQCQECLSGYYLANSQCESCQVSKCAVCKSATTCSECLNNYYLDQNELCQGCSIKNCMQCQLNQAETVVCSQCEWGYNWSLSHGHCEMSEQPEFDEPWWYWAIVGTASAVILLGVIFLIYRSIMLSRLSSQGNDSYQPFNQIR